eukprot:1454877-Rhodomonas_salina.1
MSRASPTHTNATPRSRDQFLPFSPVVSRKKLHYRHYASHVTSRPWAASRPPKSKTRIHNLSARMTRM